MRTFDSSRGRWIVSLAIVAAACGGSAEPSPLSPGEAGTSLSSPTTLPDSPDVAPSGESALSSVNVFESGSDQAECPSLPEGVTLTPIPPVAALAAVREWHEVDLEWLLSGVNTSTPDRAAPDLAMFGATHPDGPESLLSRTTLIGQRHSEGEYHSWLFSPEIAQYLSDRSDVSALVALGNGAQDGVAYIRHVFFEDKDGGFAVVGLCRTSAMIAVALDAYATESGASSSYKVLRAVATDDTALSAFGAWTLGEPISWSSRPATERLLDIEGTPAEVLDRLSLVTIVIEKVPDRWRSFDATLCTWVSEGWNECTALDADDPGEPLEMAAYTVPGEPIELWLLDQDANVIEPLALLGAFPVSSGDGGLEMRFDVISERTTLAEVLADATAGVLTIERAGGQG